jgi:hypothetical protein
MKALISTNEQRESGYRVAQVETNENIFPVAPQLYWVDCPEDLTADSKWYDPSDGQFKDFSPPPEGSNQPITTGMQEL